ncbi:MAG: hypothetical protein KJ623_03430 [Nanoarchaeota archaeon]|nr:hypothetical protein [Nanoarchaeota archaeon]MBU0962741.1 hypothetical protein [Nanoarchaeota archaeon]
MKNNWRDNVEVYLRKHLELQIRESFKHKEAYENSQNPNTAQLWIAIANLSKEMFEMNLRMKFLEKTIYDLTSKINEETHKKKKK